MILGNLRPRRGNLGHQAGLAHARIAHQPHICQKLQLQQQVLYLPRLTKLGKGRGAVGTVGKLGIAPAAAATLGNYRFLPQLRQISQNLAGICILYQRSLGNLDDARRRVMTVLVLYIAVFGCKLPMKAKIQQGIHIVVHPEDDIAAPAAITAGRASLCHKLLPAKG